MSKEIKIIPKEEMKNMDFDYSKVDKQTKNLMEKAIETMEVATKNTKLVIGEQLSMVQKQLAGNNQYDGLFQKWFTAVGLKKDVVYDCIHYYELVIANIDNQMLKELAFSKVIELHKLKDNEKKQKAIIEKAPLPEMTVKQIGKLVKEVQDGKEVTDELIAEISQKEIGSKTNLATFVKSASDLIKDLENQKQEIPEEDISKVLKLIEKVKEACSITKKDKKMEIN